MGASIGQKPGAAMARREDVAAAAGVSVCTVSLVMRGLPGVSAATRSRVLEAAGRLDYRADPVGALLAQRRRRASRELVRVVALGGDPQELARAQALFAVDGLELLPRNARAYASAAEASRRLWHEGVEGLIVNFMNWPWPDPVEAFEWDRFAAVKLSRSVPQLRLHMVRHSPFDYMEETVGRVVAAGYRNIAVLIMPSTSQRDDDARWGALLNWRARKLPPGVELDIHLLDSASMRQLPADLCARLRAGNPDALIVYHWTMWYGLEAAGWRFPEHAGLAAVLASSRLPANVPRFSGCDIQPDDRYRRAAFMLRRMLVHGERGLPAFPHEDVIEPVWIDGETLPPVH